MLCHVVSIWGWYLRTLQHPSPLREIGVRLINVYYMHWLNIVFKSVNDVGWFARRVRVCDTEVAFWPLDEFCVRSPSLIVMGHVDLVGIIDMGRCSQAKSRMSATKFETVSPQANVTSGGMVLAWKLTDFHQELNELPWLVKSARWDIDVDLIESVILLAWGDMPTYHVVPQARLGGQLKSVTLCLASKFTEIMIFDHGGVLLYDDWLLLVDRIGDVWFDLLDWRVMSLWQWLYCLHFGELFFI